MNHSFHRDLGLKKRCLLKSWLKWANPPRSK